MRPGWKSELCTNPGGECRAEGARDSVNGRGDPMSNDDSKRNRRSGRDRRSGVDRRVIDRRDESRALSKYAPARTGVDRRRTQRRISERRDVLQVIQDRIVDRLMANEDLKTEPDRLRTKNERLKGQRGLGVSLKVSEKCAVSVYGLGRSPVTLYKEQWTKLLAMAEEIRTFIKEHVEELNTKHDAYDRRETR